MAGETAPKQEGKGQTFAEFLRKAPSAAEAGLGAVALTGMVLRGEEEGKFILLTTDGQTLTLDVPAVRQHTVIQQAGPNTIVQLLVDARALSAANFGGAGGGTNTSLIADQMSHTTLAWYDTAHTIKEATSDPITETTLAWLDNKNPASDPLWDTMKEIIYDGIPGWPGIPGQAAGQAGMGAQAAQGLSPFVLATPHHAPEAAVMMQQAAAAALGQQMTNAVSGGTLKNVLTDTTTMLAADAVKPVMHDTVKEALHDTLKEMIKDPIYDTLKEATKDVIYDTVWEAGGQGTLVENIGPGNPGGPVWNFPGLMY